MPPEALKKVSLDVSDDLGSVVSFRTLAHLTKCFKYLAIISTAVWGSKS